MSFSWRAAFAAATFVLSLPASAAVALFGVGTVPGSGLDASGLPGTVTGAAGTIPLAQLGAFGSGLAYSGLRNVFIAVNDRGWSDGITTPDYPDRFQVFRIKLDQAAHTVTPTLLDTRLFKDRYRRNFIGQSGAFDTANPAASLRFDPEGVRVSRDCTLFVSDEYGPYIYEFNRRGILLRKIPVPAKFAIANPNADGTKELLPANTSGRQSNRGMEGLAISPDGRFLYGLMQNALIQDGALDAANGRIGLNNRLLRIDLKTLKTQEFVYQIDGASAGRGANEILAINDHEFLVIERDNRIGTAAQIKQIFRIDIKGATDVSGDILPSTGTTVVSGVHAGQPFKPVGKSLFIDLLDPAYGLKNANFPEKIEGLAFGPDLADGSHVLYVTSDNDLSQTVPTYIYVFTISKDTLPDFKRQKFNCDGDDHDCWDGRDDDRDYHRDHDWDDDDDREGRDHR